VKPADDKKKALAEPEPAKDAKKPAPTPLDKMKAPRANIPE